MNRLYPLKTIVLILLVLVSGLTLISKLISRPAPLPVPKNLDEKFDPNFSNIDSPKKMDELVREEFISSGHDTAQTMLFLDEFLRKKFYHSYSELSFHDNWIAYLCGKIFWSHFLNPVVPDDILRFPMAGCSQQGILFQNELNLLHIPCSSIQFYPQPYQISGHYAVTAYYGGKWHYFDSNLEPTIVDSAMPSLDEIIQRKLYTQMYTRKVHQKFKEYFTNKSYKRVDNEPFRRGNMYYFQIVTNFLSDWAWLILLVTYLFVRKK